MAGTGLIALIDDVASILDDVSVLTKVAAKKTAGVLGDDLALNAQQVAGVRADRELPVVWAVAKGSAVNKAILVPSALGISALAPWAITPLLMAGGAYLCYEGFEKIAHRFVNGGGDETEKERKLREAFEDASTDLVAEGALVTFDEVTGSVASAVLSAFEATSGRTLADGSRVFAAETVDLITYPWEWPNSLLEAAALLTLDIRERLLGIGLDPLAVVAARGGGVFQQVELFFDRSLRLLHRRIESDEFEQRGVGLAQHLAGAGIVRHRGPDRVAPVSYTHLRAHETVLDLVCRLLLEKKKKKEDRRRK